MEKLTRGLDRLYQEKEALKSKLDTCKKLASIDEKADYLQGEVVEELKKIREISDGLEEEISRENWSLPSYEDLFNSVM